MRVCSRLIPVQRLASLRIRSTRRSVGAALSLLIACANGSPYYGTQERCAAEPQSAEIAQRLLLIGDAGENMPGDPVLDLLASRAMQAPDSTTVVFLGDNIYDRGFRTGELDTPADVAEARTWLDAQLGVLEQSGAEGIFLPGNHDWDDGGRHGWTRMQDLDRHLGRVRAEGLPVTLLPPAGCPGPRTKDLGGVARLAIIDTQWWLHTHSKPGPSSPARCENLTENEVVQALQTSLRDPAASGMAKVVAAHHPLESHGPHGGHAGAEGHLFPFAGQGDTLKIPLPVIGSIYALTRKYFSPSRQDVSNPTNRAMVGRLSEEVLAGLVGSGSPPVFYVAGHDHSIQILDGGSAATLTIVSGAGSASKASRVGYDEETLFADNRTGFVEMDFLSGGAVWIGVFEPGHRAAANACPQVFSMRIEPANP